VTAAPPVMRRVVEHCRVVVDNDFAGDPDGLVGLAHHLLSPTNRVVAVTSSFLNPQLAESSSTAAEGAVLAAAREDDELPLSVVCGGPSPTSPPHSSRTRPSPPA